MIRSMQRPSDVRLDEIESMNVDLVTQGKKDGELDSPEGTCGMFREALDKVLRTNGCYQLDAHGRFVGSLTRVDRYRRSPKSRSIKSVESSILSSTSPNKLPQDLLRRETEGTTERPAQMSSSVRNSPQRRRLTELSSRQSTKNSSHSWSDHSIGHRFLQADEVDRGDALGRHQQQTNAQRFTANRLHDSWMFSGDRTDEYPTDLVLHAASKRGGEVSIPHNLAQRGSAVSVDASRVPGQVQSDRALEPRMSAMPLCCPPNVSAASGAATEKLQQRRLFSCSSCSRKAAAAACAQKLHCCCCRSSNRKAAAAAAAAAAEKLHCCCCWSSSR